jgi:hypothetical protein
MSAIQLERLHEHYIVPAGYNVAESSNGTVQTISLMWVAGEEPETVYEVSLRSADYAYLAEHNCKHVDVWRTCKAEYEAVLSPFARAMFSCIAAQCTIWVSDEQQTNDMARFWAYRLHESVAVMNREVYYIKIDIDSQRRLTVEQIKSGEDLSDIYLPKAWGTDAARLGQGFLIVPTG